MVDERRDELLDEEGIAAGSLDERCRARRRAGRTASSSETISAVWPSVSGSSPRSVTLRFPPPQAGRTSRISGREVAIRNSGPFTSAEQAVDEVEQLLLRPVQILDEQHERTLGGELLEEARGLLVQPVAGDQRMEAGGDVQAEREAEDLASLEAARGCAPAPRPRRSRSAP